MIGAQTSGWTGEQVPLYADDTLEDLQRGSFRLLQKAQGFRFGLDSVLLAAHASSFYQTASSRALKVADLGAGCGAVSILLAARLTGARITGLEIDPISTETLSRNIRLNSLGDRMSAINGDIRKLADGSLRSPDLAAGTFDLVVSNPPYQARQPDADLTDAVVSRRRRAREETDLDINDLSQAAARLLRTGGRLVLVHQVRRLPDILISLRVCGLEAKTLRLIQPLPDKAPVTVLISAIRQGRPGGFRSDPPLLVCTKPGEFSPEVAALYGLEPPMPPDELMRGLARQSERTPEYV